MLQTSENEKLYPIQWASKKLTPTESRYSITEKEMLGVFWGIKKFDYELRGRKFKLISDHKALEVIRKKSEFRNDRVARWIEKIQEYDFEIEYNKGNQLMDADVLSRIHQEEVKNLKRGVLIVKGKEQKHIIEEKGKKFWRFDTGIIREVPEEHEREKLIIEEHNRILHRGVEYVYYNIKKKWYWLGMKKKIEEVINDCNICAINGCT